jgi:ABC-type antimicrobial peptide transport system ATPase subunit
MDFSADWPKRTRLTGDLPSPTLEHVGRPFSSPCPHAQARCSTDKPVLTPVDGREVACHFPGS